jgi:hypothetical protein
MRCKYESHGLGIPEFTPHSGILSGRSQEKEKRKYYFPPLGYGQKGFRYEV